MNSENSSNNNNNVNSNDLHDVELHDEDHQQEVDYNDTEIKDKKSNDEDDDEDKQQQRPLPLSDPSMYWGLVCTLYSSSLAIILGNMLEWLDFGIYGYNESEISQQLFAGNTTVGWIMFGLGYAVRPIGAYSLGKLADDRSRKLSFMISMLGIAFGTAMMSVIPAVCGDEVTISYCVSSVWTSALPAVVLRVIQGMAAGAAAGGVNVIQSELWSTKERAGAMAQSVGVNNVSGAAASMVAAGIVLGLRAALGQIKYSAWGWRLAFLVVAPPSLIASYLMHTSMEESNDYVIQHEHDGEEDTDEDNCSISTADTPDSCISTADTPVIHHPAKHSIYDIEQPKLHDRHHANDKEGNEDESSSQTDAFKAPVYLLVVSILIQFAIAAFNNLNVFMVQYAEDNYGVTANQAVLMAVIRKAVQVCMTFPSAFLADIKGWYWAAGVGGILCAVLAMPMMLASNLGGIITAWILVAGITPAVATLWIANAPLLVTSIFPVETRSKNTSVVMAVGIATAGFFPLALNEIKNVYATGGVLTAVAAVGAIGIFFIRSRARQGKIEIFQRPQLF